jgi:hypothetical protein
MTDLVIRLRNTLLADGMPIRHEAAEEIERLRTTLDRLVDVCRRSDPVWCTLMNEPATFDEDWDDALGAAEDLLYPCEKCGGTGEVSVRISGCDQDHPCPNCQEAA